MVNHFLQGKSFFRIIAEHSIDEIAQLKIDCEDTFIPIRYLYTILPEQFRFMVVKVPENGILSSALSFSDWNTC